MFLQTSERTRVSAISSGPTRPNNWNWAAYPPQPTNNIAFTRSKANSKQCLPPPHLRGSKFTSTSVLT